ncbi:MAG TPA: GEVED domain-containing protein [Chiayiivirga sp.]|nr:GEVED domain-containing protein [Chiayiivirga sp.]
MKFRLKQALALALLGSGLALGGAVQAQSTDLRISQIYGGGGNGGATYQEKYVELFNASATPVALAGLSIQYASSAGTNWSGKTDLAGTVAANSYFLVQVGSGSNGGNIPLTPDQTSSNWAPSGTNGNLALVNGTTALTCATTACATDPAVIDLVGYGSGAAFEGTAAAPVTSSTLAAFRADGGCTDTDDNAADFSTATPVPRNSASPANACVSTHSVTPSVGTASGTIDPDTAQTVNDGATATFTLTPDTGYEIDTVGGDCPAGTLTGNSYETGAITADCTVVANFKASPVSTFVCNAAAEGFDSVPPAAWTIETGQPAGPQWVLNSDLGYGNWTNGTGTAATVSSDDLPGTYDTSLVSPSFDLTGMTWATLNYSANFQYYSGVEAFDVDITTDDGLNWTNVLSWVATGHGGLGNTPGEDVSIDLSPWAGQAGLKLRWRYHTAEVGAWDYYAQIDDVGLDCGVSYTVTPSVGTASGTIDPSTPQSVNSGTTTTFTLTPDPGYEIDTVGGDCPAGTLTGNSYETGAIVADCGVVANFKQIPPILVTKSYSPDTIEEGQDSTMTVTLTNTTASTATLTAPFVDALPAGLNATSATTNCGLVLSGNAHINATSITLPAGLGLAANSTCQIVATVNAIPVGVHVDTIDIGDVQTDQGSNTEAASATLTVTGHPEIDVTPTSLSASQVTNMTSGSTLTINNLGTSDLTWAIDESNRQPNAPSALLYDNGPLVTDVGAGSGGLDVSALQTAAGATTYGSNVSSANGFRVADDFVVPAGGWTVDTVTVYAYQTGSTTTSTMTAANLQIWNGPPGQAGSTVVFGDTTTNRMAGTAFSNIYRTLDTDLANSQRPIMAVVVTVGTTLPAGTYWVDWQLSGSLASGPWAPPVTIAGAVGAPGANALQYDGTAWVAAVDGSTAQDYPFVIDGSGSGGGGGGCTVSDVPWLSVGTTSGTTPAAGNTPVTVTFDSTGIGPGTYTANLCVASDDEDEPTVTVPVELTVTANGTMFDVTPSSSGNGSISPSAVQSVDENGSVSFTLTPDFGYGPVAAGGTCTSTLSGNTLTVGPVSAACTVEANFAPLPFPAPYCNVTFPSNVEPISRVVFTGIDNASSPDVGASPALEDFRAVPGGVVSLGGVYSIAVEGNTDGAYTAKLRVFVDWNRNGVFTDAGESFNLSDLVNTTGADGQQAVGEIAVPAGATLGDARMRVIKKFSSVADPCNAAGFGQAEDYTITVNNDPLPVPAIGVAPFSLNLTAMSGESTSGAVTISNSGEANSRLEYQIHEAIPLRPAGQISTREVMQARTNDANRLRALGLISENLALRHDLGVSVDGVSVEAASRRGAPVLLAAGDLSQMADNTPGDQGVSCNDGSTTDANSWWRRFYFNEHSFVAASTEVTKVTISTGSVDVAGGLPSTINLYTIPHSVAVDTIDIGQLTLIGTASFTASGALTSIDVPVTGEISDTVAMDLVVEWTTPGTSAGTFYPGANATTETHPTFLSAAGCSVTTPTTAAALGLPDFHLTMVVSVQDTGPVLPGCDNPNNISWLSANPLSGAILAGGTEDVTVNANAASLIPGHYEALLCIASNDPNSPRIDYTVNFDVTPLPPQIFSDGFEGDDPISVPGTYTSRDDFMGNFYGLVHENAFSELVASTAAEPALDYIDPVTGIGYTIDTEPTPDDLWFDTGLISTNAAADQVTIRFIGAPVKALGFNTWATDISVAPLPGHQVTITLSDGTTEVFNTTGPTDFRGFITTAGITKVTIEAPDSPVNGWVALDNLVIGTE